MSYLEDYLSTRRAHWPYENRYRVNTFGEHGYVAKIDEDVAGMSWTDIDDGCAVMHLRLNSTYKEYGIGTELLHKLMDHLIDLGCHTVRYTISVEHWAYQIYENLGFEIESRDMDEIHFVRHL